MEIDKELSDEFDYVVGFVVAKHYKKEGLIAKQRLLWKLTKEWNGRNMQIGIPRMVREQLGEEKATELFQDTAEKIMNDPKLLERAIKDRNELVNGIFGE